MGGNGDQIYNFPPLIYYSSLLWQPAAGAGVAKPNVVGRGFTFLCWLHERGKRFLRLYKSSMVHEYYSLFINIIIVDKLCLANK